MDDDDQRQAPPIANKWVRLLGVPLLGMLAAGAYLKAREAALPEVILCLVFITLLIPPVLFGTQPWLLRYLSRTKLKQLIESPLSPPEGVDHWSYLLIVAISFFVTVFLLMRGHT